MRRYLLHSCVFLQLEGLEQQLTSSLATGRDSAGRWSQMHSSVALQQRMSQLKDRGGARLQKLQDALLDKVGQLWLQEFQVVQMPKSRFPADLQTLITAD